MDGRTKLVNSTDELLRAAADKDVRQIIVCADLDGILSIKLLPGQNLRSNSEHHATLTFRENTDGLQLSSDNAVSGLRLIARRKDAPSGMTVLSKIWEESVFTRCKLPAGCRLLRRIRF